MRRRLAGVEQPGGQAGGGGRCAEARVGGQGAYYEQTPPPAAPSTAVDTPRCGRPGVRPWHGMAK
eukprot:1269440-Pyramimonas_sp.AAC.1